MGIILWVVFGALVGWIASVITGGGSGILADVIIGIVGSLIGGFVMNFFGYGGITGFNLYSFVVAVLGACILIIIVRAVQ